MGRSLILITSGFLIVFGIVQRSVQNNQKTIAKRTPAYYAAEQSKNVAASMMEVAEGNLNNFSKSNRYFSKAELKGRLECTSSSNPCPILNGEAYIQVDSISAFQNNVLLTIKGTVKTATSIATTTIKTTVWRQPFSTYAYFSDTQRSKSGLILLIGDDINGPTHTNGKFYFYGSPTINGPISSRKGKKNYAGATPTFNGSTNFNSKKIKLPAKSNQAIELAKEENGGIGEFKKDIYVNFKGGNKSQDNDGTVEISNPVKKCVEYKNKGKGKGKGRGKCEYYTTVADSSTTITYDLSEFNDVISSEKDVYVKGEIDGNVTVHSSKDTHIVGDITYENKNLDDKSGTISNDRLGLISKHNIIIDDYAEQDHGTKDLTIYGSLLNLHGAFVAEDARDKKLGFRGTVKVIGGLITKHAGLTYTTSGGKNVSGLSDQYSYDPRFKTKTTPGYPRKTDYSFNSWQETTTVKQR